MARFKALSVAVVTTMALAGADRGYAETVLQFNRWLPPTQFIQTEVLDAWAADVTKATEGRVKVVMTASSLGATPRQFELVKDGIADIGWGVQSYTPSRFKTNRSVELPFLSNSAESLSVAFWRAHQEYFSKANEYAGVKLLSLHVHPPGHIFTSKKELTSVNDVQGLKIRIVNPATEAIARKLGIVPISAPSTKAYEMLSSGVLDGTFFTDDSIPGFKLTNFIHSKMEFDGGLYSSAFFLVMNQRKWDALSKQDQEIISKLSGEHFSKRMGQVWDKYYIDAKKGMEAGGVKVLRIDGSALADVKEKLKGAEADWIAEVQSGGVDGAAALALIRKVVSDFKN
jgi:TRAP-type C4-dicarboxylate transport system substrate-binding protein